MVALGTPIIHFKVLNEASHSYVTREPHVPLFSEETSNHTPESKLVKQDCRIKIYGPSRLS
ncbi:rCG61665 [Rattus norvegicus]|uniref:RCG61665 n=1 Tax=Rattus norvegicus TaxID=10116 RepID=A6HAC5_RAT|nr:rCG61665 [Rattus norvegicus]